jgi:cytochrome c2
MPSRLLQLGWVGGGLRAGATFDRTEENLARCFDNPDEMKPGAKLPDLGLSPEQIDALIAHLETLE